ncbi:MAG: hypothetical protein KatS3mg077_3348 [Candidatus Binatia bacterium]|nr:MAG: hypothetical protein KatS3mg077_3348 [Candidatus Binatia bacterium]
MDTHLLRPTHKTGHPHYGPMCKATGRHNASLDGLQSQGHRRGQAQGLPLRAVEAALPGDSACPRQNGHPLFGIHAFSPTVDGLLPALLTISHLGGAKSPDQLMSCS